MRTAPQTRLNINRRNRLNRLYPRRQRRQDVQSSSINQIIQQNYNSDIENQNSDEPNNNPSNFINSDLVSDEQRLRLQFQQIWLQSFRQQIQQQGVNSNVLVIQQRSQQKAAKGLSRDEIKKFQRITFTYQDIDKLTEQDIICSICLEQYECDKKLIKLPCNHIYHSHCITKWLLQDHKCPLCRNVLKNTSC